MTTTLLIILAIAGWLVAALAVGTIIGLSIRLADRRKAKGDDVPDYPPADD